MKLRRMGVTVAIGLIAAAAFLSLAHAADAIKIGVVLPLSGRYASAGQGNKRGIDLVVNEINKGGGIKALGGAQIQLVVADDASDQVTTSQEARRLINQEKVSFILGPYATPEGEAIAPVAERGSTGVLSTQSSFDGLFQRNYRFFSSVSMVSSQFGLAYADFVAWLNKEHAGGIKTVAITFPNNDYGQIASKAASERLTRDGIKVLESFGFPPNASDLTPIVQRVKNLNPDAIVSIGYLQDGLLLHRARVAQDYSSKPIWIGGSDAFSNDRLWELLGDDVAKGALGGRTFALAQFDNGVQTPGVKWLVNAASASGLKPAEVDQAMAAGAQVAWILVQAIEELEDDRSRQARRCSPERETGGQRCACRHAAIRERAWLRADGPAQQSGSAVRALGSWQEVRRLSDVHLDRAVSLVEDTPDSPGAGGAQRQQDVWRDTRRRRRVSAHRRRMHLRRHRSERSGQEHAVPASQRVRPPERGANHLWRAPQN